MPFFFNYLLLGAIICGAFTGAAKAQSPDSGKLDGSTKELLFSDDFNSKLDPSIWISEIEPILESSVYSKDGKLVLNTKGGVTVWLNKSLRGNIQIEYIRKVIVKGGVNDRLSDLNNFWMATDLKNRDLFTRNGRFEAYDSLRLYYVGMGGNTNTTTRFRKYDGKGEKRLLQEYLDENHLLMANTEYRIKIIVKNNTTSFWVNDKCYFSYKDPDILKEGYFGFRSTYSHQEIDHFRVYRLK